MGKEKYDIAISFLARDESIAQEIHKKLSKFFEVFLYSKRQEDLAGTDGMDSFSEIFKTQSKTVLVLYREEWGHTKWTRVENNAIKSRCFNSDGFDFLLFVPLEKAKLPSWVPETEIYFDYQIYGLNGLIPVAHSHLKRNGVKEKKNRLEALISEVENDLTYEQKLEGYFNSPKSADDFSEETTTVDQLVESRINEINKANQKVKLFLKREREVNKIRFNGHELGYFYRLSHSNTSKYSYLKFKLYKGLTVGYRAPDEEPVLLMEKEFKPSLDRLGNFVWISSSNKQLTSNELAEKLLELLIKYGTGKN